MGQFAGSSKTNIPNHLGQAVKNVGALVILLIYSLIGAFVFRWVENRHHELSVWSQWNEARQQRLDAEQKLVDQLQTVCLSQFYQDIPKLFETEIRYLRNASAEPLSDAVLPPINEFELSTLPADAFEEASNKTWTLWDGFYYASTLYTTIGYGDITCLTRLGQILTMVYTIVGIPIFVIVLNVVGGLLFHLSCYLNHGCRQAVSKICSLIGGGDRLSCCQPSPAAFNEVPLSFSFATFMLWTCCCSALFSWHEEEMSYFDAFYFLFISLTTVGLGDVTPADRRFSCLTFIFVIVGLSLVTMMLNIIEAKLENSFDRILARMRQNFKHKMQSAELDSDPDGVQKLIAQLSLNERIKFSLMSDQQVNQLTKAYNKMDALRNRTTQTDYEGQSVEVQTSPRDSDADDGDKKRNSSYGSVNKIELVNKHSGSSTRKRKRAKRRSLPVNNQVAPTKKSSPPPPPANERPWFWSRPRPTQNIQIDPFR